MAPLQHRCESRMFRGSFHGCGCCADSVSQNTEIAAGTTRHPEAPLGFFNEYLALAVITQALVSFTDRNKSNTGENPVKMTKYMHMHTIYTIE